MELATVNLSLLIGSTYTSSFLLGALSGPFSVGLPNARCGLERVCH